MLRLPTLLLLNGVAFTATPAIARDPVRADRFEHVDHDSLGISGQARTHDSVVAPQVATDALKVRGRPVLGLREINAGDPQYAGGVIPDCTGVGVGTDAGPALRAAAAAWVAAGPGAVLRVPAGRYRLATAIDLNLNGQAGMVFDASDATFTPDKTAFRALDFHNGLQAVIKARFVEGGPFGGWAAKQPYPVDYGAVADAVEAGGQEAIRISGITGYSVDLTAENYAGRLLRVARARSGEPTTGGIKGVIRTSRGRDLSRPRVGQSLFTDNGKNPFTGYWGHLDGLHNDFDAYAPVWRDVNDVAISYLDGAYAYNGPSLQGVGVFKGGIIYVGDIDSNARNVHFDVSPSPVTGRLSSRLSINQLTMLNAGNGLRIETPDPSARAADIRQVTMVGSGPGKGADLSFGNAATLNNAKGVLIGALVGEGYGGSLLAVTGAASDDVRVGLYAKGLSGNFTFIAPEVTGRVQLSGRMSDPIPGRSVLTVGGNTPVRLDNLDVSASNGASLINVASASNRVRWVSGSKSGTAPLYADKPPAYVAPAVELP
ncbi:hypothetical protein [Methylobacterium aquaticum]|uniref:Pectate lyase superfamily protein domain-containing protein n=1 Tax=Methylobacterium aquaticum TaxID=270351 RepID=A0A0J6T5Q9_9HYPH|nr:hypothetical protein [Methylobacterium aquaticum]KMO41147.1 hypothetical protein VP06_01315 [Methylobacterium aquaticum]